MMDPWKLIEGM